MTLYGGIHNYALLQSTKYTVPMADKQVLGANKVTAKKIKIS